MTNCNMVLPKLWLQRISRFWDKRIPQNYPVTNSEFSLEFSSDEVTEAVKTMESALNTEESIVTSDMVSDGQRLGNYLGTYDVSGVAGELTLLSPEKVSNSDIGVIAFHYNETNEAWEKIEDAQIVNGYVYGTLESFSPISIFTLRRDTIFQENNELMKSPTFIANGIPVVITKNESDEIVVKDANGKETVITEDTTIIGGTIDGTSVESVSIYAKGVTLKRIRSGSYSMEDTVVKVDNISCKVEDCTFTMGISGGSYNCRVENMDLDIKNSNLYFISTGESILGGKDSNTFETLGYGSNAWTKKATINIENSEIEYLYTGGNNGNFYAGDVIVNIKDGHYSCITTGGSNGISDTIKMNISNAKVDNYQTINRGIVNNSNNNITNCDITELFITGSKNDDITGTVNNVSFDITGGKVVLFAGKNNDKDADVNEINRIIKALKISRTTEVSYGDKDTASVLKDSIRIK